jgi:hypothetical protein
MDQTDKKSGKKPVELNPHATQCNIDVGKISEKCVITPKCFEFYPITLCYLYAHPITSEEKDYVADLITNCFGHRCEECITRAIYFCTLSGQDGSHFDPMKHCPIGSPVLDLVKKLSILAKEITSRKATGMYIILPDLIFLGNFNPHKGKCKKFFHFTLRTSKSSSDARLVFEYPKYYKQSFSREIYFDITRFTDVFSRIKKLDVSEIIMQKTACDYIINTGKKVRKPVKETMSFIDTVYDTADFSVDYIIEYIFECCFRFELDMYVFYTESKSLFFESLNSYHYHYEYRLHFTECSLDLLDKMRNKDYADNITYLTKIFVAGPLDR